MTLIEQAFTLAPNDMAIRDEKDAVAGWNEEIEEAMRSVEAQSVEAEQTTTVWSQLWAAVTELAA